MLPRVPYSRYGDSFLPVSTSPWYLPHCLHLPILCWRHLMELLDAVGKSESGARWQGKGCPPTILAPLEHFDLEVFLHCWLTDCVLSCSSSSVVDNKGGGGSNFAGSQLSYNMWKLAQWSYLPAHQKATFLLNCNTFILGEEKRHVRGVNDDSHKIDDLQRKKKRIYHKS